MRRGRLGDFVIACRKGVSKSIVPTLPLLASLVGCSQRATTEPSNMMCVRRLQMPSYYPSIAQSARVSMASPTAKSAVGPAVGGLLRAA